MSTRRNWRKEKNNRRKHRLRKYNVGKYIFIIILCIAIGVATIKYKTVNTETYENLAVLDEIETEVYSEQEEEEDISSKVFSEEETEEIEEESEEEKVLVETIIAQHSIENSASDEDRNANMNQAAIIINGETDGYILEPGEKFSWLEVVGNTTPEKGFKKATVIKNHQYVKDYGGGVCQVSSTINSAVQEAGISGEGNLYAVAHSLPSSYIKPENGDKEATVTYDGGKDFWFINILEYPIRMKVETDGGCVTVTIYSRTYE